jgi:glycosyltransferase involved in cell wall biosynthesis
MEITVSVIMPVFNSHNYLIKAIDSVLSQSFTNYELLIIDDNSDERTKSILENYKKIDGRIKVFTLTKRMGASFARNIGIESSSGKYIAFLDSDDYWLPKKLLVQVQFMNKYNLKMCHSSYYLIIENNEYVKVNYKVKSHNITYKKLLINPQIGCLTVMIEKETLKNFRFPNIKKRNDFILWLEILKTIPYSSPITDTLGVYRIHRNSLSQNKFKLIKYQWCVYRQFESLGVINSMLFLIIWGTLGLKKYLTFFFKYQCLQISKYYHIILEINAP